MNTAQLHNCQGRHFCPSFFPKKPGGFPAPKTNISHKISEIFLKTSSKFHKICLHLSTIHINLLPYKYTCRYIYVSIYFFLFKYFLGPAKTPQQCVEKVNRLPFIKRNSLFLTVTRFWQPPNVFLCNL